MKFKIKLWKPLRIFLIGISMFFSFSIQAQNPEPNKDYVNQLNQIASEAYLTNPQKTQEYAEKALILAKKLDFKKGIADAYYNQSLIYKLKGNYSEELNLLLLSYQEYKILGLSVELAKIYNAMGTVYYSQEDYPNAQKQFDQALAIYEKLQLVSGKAETLKKIGNIYAAQSKYTQSLKYYKAALKIQEELQNEIEIANLYNNMGVNLYELNKLDEALPYYERALSINFRLKNNNRLPAAYHNLARVYLRQKKLAEALELAEKGLKIAQQIDLRPAIVEATLLISEIQAQRNEFFEAYMNYKRHIRVRDSIYNLETARKISQMQAKYEVEKQEQKIKILSQERTVARLLGLGVFIFLLITLIVGAWVINNQRWKIRKEREIVEKNQEIHQMQQALTLTDLTNQQLKNQQIQQELDFQNKALTTYTLNFAQKNNLIQDIRLGINELLQNTDKTTKMNLSRLVKLADYALEVENDWDEFKLYFEKVHNNFFENIKNQYPDLSNGDLRLCALIRLNMNIKELANILGISPESVKMARHRLRKKLNLVTEDNLIDFVMKF